MTEEEQTSEERQKQRDADVPFVQALQNASNPNYLGDVQLLQTMLRFYGKQAIDALAEKNQVDYKGDLQKIANRVSKILLGDDKSYTVVPGWNQPGRIDVALAESLGLDETNPQERMAHAFLLMVGDLTDIAYDAGANGILDEQWQGSVDALFERYALIFAGLDDAGQAALMLSNIQES